MPDRPSLVSPPQHLLSEPLPSVTASTAIFANAPAGTKMISLTIRSAGLTVRFDAGAATAGANGLDYASGQTYEFALSQTEALKVRAIQNGGTASGWTTYWGL